MTQQPKLNIKASSWGQIRAMLSSLLQPQHWGQSLAPRRCSGRICWMTGWFYGCITCKQVRPDGQRGAGVLEPAPTLQSSFWASSPRPKLSIKNGTHAFRKQKLGHALLAAHSCKKESQAPGPTQLRSRPGQAYRDPSKERPQGSSGLALMHSREQNKGSRINYFLKWLFFFKRYFKNRLVF